MPFKSKAQQRLFFAKEQRGELPKGTAKRWAKHTPDIKKLPERKGSEKKSFVRGFVTTFLAKLGMSKEAAAKTLTPVLVKLAEQPPPPSGIPAPVVSTKELETLENARKAQKAREELGRGAIAAHVVSPFILGSAAGYGLAKAFRPSDTEVGNLQKEELLSHYDSAIEELERRIAARG
jgi:hypothetical protein